MIWPSISFIVISYNRPKYLALCLASLKRQLVKDYEIIVSDDGSDTEEWRQIAKEFGAKTVARQHDYLNGKAIRNTPAVVNQGVALAENQIIQILQQDHILAPDFGLWLATTIQPGHVMFGLTEQKDGIFTLADLDAMVRVTHLPFGEVRFDNFCLQGRGMLQEFHDWRAADGMDWAVSRSMWQDLDTRFMGQDHSILDYMLNAQLRGLHLTINPFMRLWHMIHEKLPDPEFWQAQIATSAKIMESKWNNLVWSAQVVMPQFEWLERRKEIAGGYNGAR